MLRLNDISTPSGASVSHIMPSSTTGDLDVHLCFSYFAAGGAAYARETLAINRTERHWRRQLCAGIDVRLNVSARLISTFMLCYIVVQGV